MHSTQIFYFSNTYMLQYKDDKQVLYSSLNYLTQLTARVSFIISNHSILVCNIFPFIRWNTKKNILISWLVIQPTYAQTLSLWWRGQNATSLLKIQVLKDETSFLYCRLSLKSIWKRTCLGGKDTLPPRMMCIPRIHLLWPPKYKMATDAWLQNLTTMQESRNYFSKWEGDIRERENKFTLIGKCLQQIYEFSSLKIYISLQGQSPMSTEGISAWRGRD